MDHPPTGTTTFLFTDIEGSSRMWESHPVAMSASLAAHDDIVANAISRHGGYVFSRGGDAFAAAFVRAAEAVAAALEAREELADHDFGEAPILVRMGLHTGEAEERDGDYFGQDLNRCARLMTAAHGGQIVVSGTTAELVADRLPAGIGLVDHGPHRLKDLSEPLRIFEVVDGAHPHDFPPLRTLRVATGSLPTGMTEIVGRDHDVAEIALLLTKSRLITLVGPGGVGKTRLAVHLGEEVAGRFADGVWFVGLAELKDPALIPKQIAIALGIQEQADRSMIETIVTGLRDRDLLIVLDNCEHLVDDVARTVHELQTAAARIRVLATSRERLGISGEQVWTVPTLGLPSDSDTAMSSAAVRLFVERARSVDIGFDPDEPAMAAVVEICRRVDGLPLAIELAAARVTVLSVAEIADRLGRRIDLLGGGARGSERRQETMRAAIAWSHDLLTAEERTMFRRLAVFRGGFTLEACESIVADDRDSAVTVLGRLVDQSLVVSKPTPRSRRFSMLETVRAYSAELLEASDEIEALRARHAEFFAKWARGQARLLGTSAQLEALEALEVEHDNLRAVLSNSFEGRDVERAVLLAADLSFFWWLHSHFAESRDWCDRLMSASDAVSDRSRAKFLVGAGQMAMGVCDYEVAAERFAAAHRLATVAKADRIAAWALANAMTNETYQLHLDEARALGLAALDGFEAVGDVGGSGYVAYMNVAVSFAERVRQSGLDPSGAAALLEQLEPVQTAAEALGERNFLGHTSELMGSVLLLGGDDGEAGVQLGRAVAAFDTIGNQSCLAHAIERAALYASHGGHAGGAVELLGAAAAIRQRIGVEQRVAEAEISALIVERCRARLTEADFDRFWSAGGALRRSDAVARSITLLDQ